MHSSVITRRIQETPSNIRNTVRRHGTCTAHLPRVYFSHHKITRMPGLWPSPAPLERKHAITFVRLSIKPLHVERLDVTAKPLAVDWAATVERIESQSGWAGVCLGYEAERPDKPLIVIIWKNNTEHAPFFRSGSSLDGSTILRRLRRFCSRPPEVITLWHACYQAGRDMATIPWASGQRGGEPGHPGGMAELIRLQGPRNALKAAIAEIQTNIAAFKWARVNPFMDNDARYYVFDGGSPFILEDEDDQVHQSSAEDGEHTDDTSEDIAKFGYVLFWASKLDRDKFRNPAIPHESSVIDSIQGYGGTCWEEMIAKLLRRLVDEHGVHMSSWDYYADKWVA
ncbi:hypothetical protein CC79DRAFT_49091 [Sarocladium strictum]